MTKSLTIQDLQPLLAPHPAPCLSIFLPTHRYPPDANQDPIRFKNLLGTAEDLLRQRYAPKDIRTLIEPLQVLLDNGFWQEPSDGGLAVFRSSDVVAHYWIPQPLPEVAVVADTFHLKPLFRFLRANRRFFVLALSKNSVAFYKGTPYTLIAVDLPALPPISLTELGAERREPGVNHHASATSGAAIVHGHEALTADKKEELARFFGAIDNALWEVLRDERAPLVLVGVGCHHALYRATSRYQYLAERGVEDNCAHASLEELHAKVWPIVSEFFQAREDEILNEYATLAGNSQVTSFVARIAETLVFSKLRRGRTLAPGNKPGAGNSRE